MSEQIEVLLKELKLLKEHRYPYLEDDLRDLYDDFDVEFEKLDPKLHCMYGDLSMYLAYIEGLACGGIMRRLDDAFERFKMRYWLEKSFFDRYPQYRFLERWDLSDYPDLRDLLYADKARKIMLQIIAVKEKHTGEEG